MANLNDGKVLDKKSPIVVLSLGAGVQSSTLALKAATGVIERVDAAIFADTQNEPIEVMQWLSKLEHVIQSLQFPFPIYRVTKGNLGEDSLRIRRSKKSNLLYIDHAIPAYTEDENGKIGLLSRRCTNHYKIIPVQKKVKELLGVSRAPKTIQCKMMIGISIDEAHRMRPSRVNYIENAYPLIDLRMSRSDCMDWIRDNFKMTPPRSACTFCPFKSDSEWMHMKTNAPIEFKSVVDFERRMQDNIRSQQTLKGMAWLHKSRKPIDDVDFSKGLPSHNQLNLFGNECDGMCGV